MNKMFRYEIKKVFSRTSSKIAVLVLAIVLAIVCYLAMDVSFVNDKGEEERGYESLETPIYYDYMMGWTQLLENSQR